MKSLMFPDIFNSNSTRVWKSTEYLEATKQNTVILLHCNRGELFGDPYFGTAFREYLFDQNSIKLQDIIIDMIYTQLALFIPQVKIDRNNIEVTRDAAKGKVYVSFSGINQIDFNTNMYQLVVFDSSDF